MSTRLPSALAAAEASAVDVVCLIDLMSWVRDADFWKAATVEVALATEAATARAREVRAKPRVAMAVAVMRRVAVSRGTHLSSPVTKANIHLQAGVRTGAVALPVGAMVASRVRMQFSHPSRALLTLDSPIRPGWLPGRPRWPAGRWLVGDSTAPSTLLMLQLQE